MEELHNLVEKGKALDRLLNNADFKEIILTDFLEKSSLVLSSQLATIRQEMRGAIVEQLLARSHLRSYLNMVLNDANNAQAEINFQNSNKEEIDE
jgi:hypothetical protein